MTGLPPPLERPDMDARAAFLALVGGWQLVLWTTHHPDGMKDYPFGRDAAGQIMYSPDGHMRCHLMRTDRPLFDRPSVYHVDDAALGRSMRGYSGYFGSFSVDASAGIVTHHVTGAWYPDWIGTDQTRRYAFAGDRLYLEADVGSDLVRIEWRKVNAPSARDL
ncbi:hypothetical protein J3E64_002103 [Sphingobium sp. OAS761]|uniref:lipocalin-like domain-containing protein n=1 Tax=Sphingobium sp. OAS761 TaxID=2817901 RepID=UPI00209E34C7|nr:lipocalin-like domain-containing protein [Sphingobium sp. OAS761]MCP1470415.1 hypothetical protein [Sphingobium sp. OAS761]